MFDKALKVVDDDTLTILDKDAQFEGKLTFEDKVQINGKFTGEVFSDGTLIIGEGADVDAKIEVGTVIIQGNVTGNIQAKQRIEMHPPAVVKGEISSPGLVVTEGAIFEGNCRMGQESTGEVVEFNPIPTPS